MLPALELDVASDLIIIESNCISRRRPSIDSRDLELNKTRFIVYNLIYHDYAFRYSFTKKFKTPDQEALF